MAKEEPSSKLGKAHGSSNTAKGKGIQGIENLDKGGLGKPLYEPKDRKAKVDIVFVHGINGDRIGTWTHKGNKAMWPKDFLPEKLPEARIVSFGYNAKFAGFYPGKIAPELTIDDYSTSLLESVRALRKGEEERPIIFVAHSMGGLVVANALSRDFKSNDALQSIPDHTIGTLFLGTPFQGSSLASYGSLAIKLLDLITNTQPDSLETLEKKSKKLADINTKFAKFLRNRDQTHGMPRLQLACFFECLPISGNTLVVPKDSATWPGVDPRPIDEDHKNMCRFDRSQRDGFQNVSNQLVQWIDEYEANEKAGVVGGGHTEIMNVSGNVDHRGSHSQGSVLTGHVTTNKKDGIRISVDNKYESNNQKGPGASQGSQSLSGKGGRSG